MNKSTGDLGCGIKLMLFDRPLDEELVNLKGEKGYKISIIGNEPEFWAIQIDDSSAWVTVQPELLGAIEVLGEL